MGLANDDDPIFFYHKMPQSSRGRAFDGVVTPSEIKTTTISNLIGLPTARISLLGGQREAMQKILVCGCRRPFISPIPQGLLSRAAGEFAWSEAIPLLIAADSATLANPQADGIAILSLTPNVKLLDFIPSFRRVFSFTPDGRQSAMLKYNSDFTQSIFLITNQGLQKELSRTAGEFLNCLFDLINSQLYYLLTRRNPGMIFMRNSP